MMRAICAAAVAAGLAGCAAAPLSPEFDAFEDLESRVGQKLSVRGFLNYEFENHNLFPTRADESWESCMPVEGKTEEVARALSRAHASHVALEGVVQRFKGEGVWSHYYCKDFGLMVTSVRPR